ncbi:MAG: ATP-binding protein [Candidatus Omnitrophica bacterium]|nr:ATP-binding protein [Candidatus Omnitrophota bacterium]
MEIIRRSDIRKALHLLRSNPVVALLGPRQSGKTTLSCQIVRRISGQAHFFDCENPRDVQRLSDPLTTLTDLEGMVVIDEIQRVPGLFPVLRVLADRGGRVKYLILGSASAEMLRQSSETLAGRIAFMEISGFHRENVPSGKLERLWLRGGFPRSYLAKGEAGSFQWRQDFIATFLERDIPNLGLQIPPRMLQRFWSMLAHYHGRLFNASEIGRSLGVSDHTARRYLDLLAATFMIREIKPWFYNTKKRIIKSPKIYFRDSGILHALLSIEDKKGLITHPQLGGSWEGFAVEEAIRVLEIREHQAFFWGVHTGAEMDLVFEKNGRLYGIEVKYTQVPAMTFSIKAAINDLSLEHVWIIYPGTQEYPLSKNVTVSPLSGFSFKH